MLTEAFIISEQEELIFLESAAEGATKAVSLKLWNASLIEEVSCVKSAVAKEVIHGPMQIVRAGRGDDADLAARSLAVLCPVRIRDNIELANSIHTQKLTAGAAWSVVDDRSPGELDSVEQEQVFLRAAAFDREHVTDR